jgi:hypothetical protein
VTFVAVFIGSMILTLFQHLGVSVITVPVSVLISLLISSAGVTEFIFVLYCKLRFPSFNISLTDEFEMKKKISKEDAIIAAQLKSFRKQEREEKAKRKKAERTKK